MRLDASYNMCSKLGSKLIFDEIMAVLVLPDHLPILTAFSYGRYCLESDPTKSMRTIPRSAAIG
jgi:hypothetical protein